MEPGFEVIVVGLGHAGCEAALCCARRGLATLGVTLRRSGIAQMSCNPAVGGTAKGQLVRELDALGGEMGRIADLTGTHFRTLNASRGPAVRASRVLCDRARYPERMQASLAAQPNLTLLEGEVRALCVRGARICGVRLADGTERAARAVVVTTGTFLEAMMHLGEEREPGGRRGDDAARGLSGCLRELGFSLGRFKTGTPPRLVGATIDFARLEAQPGDRAPRPLSLRTASGVAGGERFPALPQVSCHLAFTNPRTHALVRSALPRSPLYRGDIVGRGPRYCPSLEDKVVRFADRERHQLFLEPEGGESPLVYPAGLSTSLPAEVQLELLRSMVGLEQVEMAVPGYAVEYDYAPPTQLRPTLETRAVEGLYFAGQLNGTSGYEEAAFQGLLAGINAGSAVRGEPPLVLGRHEAHGAVLIDELTSRGVDEPFRMLTARSEHRLRLREGNSDLRLRAHGHRVGLVSSEELQHTEDRRLAIAREIERLRASPVASLLRRPEVSYAALAAADPGWPVLPAGVGEEVEFELKYEAFLVESDRAAARRSDAYDGWRIPPGLGYPDIRGLSAEAAEKLALRRPDTVGEARRIPGLTPAAIALLCVHLRRVGAAPRAAAIGEEQGPVDKVCAEGDPHRGPVFPVG